MQKDKERWILLDALHLLSQIHPVHLSSILLCLERLISMIAEFLWDSVNESHWQKTGVARLSTYLPVSLWVTVWQQVILSTTVPTGRPYSPGTSALVNSCNSLFHRPCWQRGKKRSPLLLGPECFALPCGLLLSLPTLL